MQLKEHHSSTVLNASPVIRSPTPSANQRPAVNSALSLDQVLSRFHSLLLSPTTPLSQPDLQALSFLFSFYQSHISNLQTKLATVDNSAGERYRQMAEESAAIAAEYRQRETALLSQLETVNKENARLQSSLDEVSRKHGQSTNKEREEREKLKERADRAEREKNIIEEKIGEMVKKVRESDEKDREIAYLNQENARLRESAQGLIDEVCKHKFRVKELELETEALKDIKEIALKMGAGGEPRYGQNTQASPEQPHSEFERKFADKLFQDYANGGNKLSGLPPPSNLNMKSPKLNDLFSPNKKLADMFADDTPANYRTDKQYSHPTSAHQSGSETSLPSPPKLTRQQSNVSSANNPLSLAPTATPPHPVQKAPAGSNPYLPPKPTNMPHNPLPITSLPAHKGLEINSNLIHTLESELSTYQDRRKMVQAELCRLPDRPKKSGDREKKDKLEGELDTVEQKISELKKRLREISKI